MERVWDLEELIWHLYPPHSSIHTDSPSRFLVYIMAAGQEILSLNTHKATSDLFDRWGYVYSNQYVPLRLCSTSTHEMMSRPMWVKILQNKADREAIDEGFKKYKLLCAYDQMGHEHWFFHFLQLDITMSIDRKTLELLSIGKVLSCFLLDICSNRPL